MIAVTLDRVDDRPGDARLLEDRLPVLRMARGIALVIEVVKQPGDGPGLLVLPVPARPKLTRYRRSVTGCGCLVLIAGVVALLVIFVRGSFDSGEPIDTAVALLAVAVLAIERRQRERSAHELVRPRGA